MPSRDAGLVKRQQIASANRMMFAWIVAASVILGASAVTSVFMVKKGMFNNKVLAAKNETVDTLKKNNEAVEELRKNVRLLNNDPALESSKAFADEQTIRVILDALPDDENIPALGASLQQVLLKPEDPDMAIEVESISFSSVGGDAAGTDVSTGGSSVSFNVKVTADSSGPASPMAKLNNILQRLERSIRAIDIKNLKLEVGESSATMTFSAVAYYEPAKTLELKDKAVRP